MPLSYFTNSTPLTPLRDPFNLLVDAINEGDANALVVADLNALAAETPSGDGAMAFVVEGAITFRSASGVWVQRGMATFASTSARDTAYAKASAAYRLNRVEALDTSTGIVARYNGSAWRAWSSGLINWTPTLAAGAGTFSVGNGTQTARYQYVQGTIHWEYRLILGSTSLMGTNPTITLPVNDEAGVPSYAVRAHGSVGNTTGATITDAVAYRSGSSQSVVVLATWNVASTYPAVTGLTASVPAAWGTGWFIELRGSYTPA